MRYHSRLQWYQDLELGILPRQHCMTVYNGITVSVFIMLVKSIYTPVANQVRVYRELLYHNNTCLKMAWMFVFLSATIQLTMPEYVVAQDGLKITPKAIASSGIDQCPLLEESKAIQEGIKNEIRNILQPYSVPNQCGDGLWYRVAYLNMSDRSFTAVSICLERVHFRWDQSVCTTRLY